VPVHIARFGPGAELQRHGLYELLRAAAAVPKAADEVIRRARRDCGGGRDPRLRARRARADLLTRNACSCGTCGPSNDVAAGVIGRDKVSPLT
jgi:hypothetical protein